MKGVEASVTKEFVLTIAAMARSTCRRLAVTSDRLPFLPALLREGKAKVSRWLRLLQSECQCVSGSSLNGYASILTLSDLPPPNLSGLRMIVGQHPW